MNTQNFLKSYSSHDEALLATMTHMIQTNPNAKIIEASYNFISVEGDGLGDFLKTLVDLVPVSDMKFYKANLKPHKQVKKVKTHKSEVHCIYFTFYGLL